MIITNTVIVSSVIGLLVLMSINYRRTSPPDRVKRVTEDMSDEEIVFHLIKESIAARGRYRVCVAALSLSAAILVALLISNGIHGQLFVSKSRYSYHATFFWLSLISIGLMAYTGVLLDKIQKVKDLLHSMDNGTGMVDDLIDKKIEEYENKYK